MSSFQVEMTLEGYRLPKSTSVIYWAVSNLTSEAHFPNPEQFLPERWLRDCSRSSKAAHSHVRLPFGHGPRMCVGRRCPWKSKEIQDLNIRFRFAEVEMHVLVITLLRRFHISYHHSPVSIATSFVNKPDRPLKLRFLARGKDDNHGGAKLKNQFYCDRSS